MDFSTFYVKRGSMDTNRLAITSLPFGRLINCHVLCLRMDFISKFMVCRQSSALDIACLNDISVKPANNGSSFSVFSRISQY